MPYLPRIPRLGEIHWSELAHRGRKGFEKIPSSARSNVGGYVSEHSPTEEDLEEFSHDWSNVNNMRGSKEALRAVPQGNLKNRLRKITDGTSAQQVGGGIGALTGSAVGAGIGGTVMGLAKGKGAVGRGLLAGTAMGVLPGYFTGRNMVSKHEILTALRDDLGPGAGIKQAYAEEGFDLILEELYEAKNKGNLTPKLLRETLIELRNGRGRGLSPSEMYLIHRHIMPPGNTIFRPEGDMFSLYLKSPGPPGPPGPSGPSASSSLKRSRVAPLKTGLLKSKAGRVAMGAAGGMAAMAALGLTAAKYWPRDEDSRLKD